MDAAERRKLEALDCWPFIPSEVPGRKLNILEEINLEDAVPSVVDFIRQEVRRVGIGEKFIDQENHPPYNFLLEIMLKHSRTIDQLINNANGYLAYCERESGHLNSALREMTESDEFFGRARIINMNMAGGEKLFVTRNRLGKNRYDTLTLYARNNVVDCIVHGLAPQTVHKYSNERFCDGFYFLISDPEKVDLEVFDEDSTVIERKTPENKRMTEEKLVRLLQLPGLEKYMEEDNMMIGLSFGSNLAIIAEYFCENDDAVFLNEINESMISKWLSEKFVKFNPPLEVAFYVLARFQNTSFEICASFIERYILALHEKNDPWIFEAAGLEMKTLSRSGDVFDLYIKALQNLQENSDDPNYRKLLGIIPGRELVQVFTNAKNEGCKERAENYLKNLKVRMNQIVPEYPFDAFKENPDQWIINVLNDDFVVPKYWKEFKGFELLDPFLIESLKFSLRSGAVNSLKQKIFDNMSNLDLSILLIFRNRVVLKIKNPELKQTFENKIAELIEVAYSKSVSESLSVEELMRIVKGEEVDLGKIIPAVRTLPPEMRRIPNREKLGNVAETALLMRSFAGARGEQEIVKYLLRYRGSMRAADLVMPFPDAPNLEIIGEYRESPNLLLFLSISTILMYLGYSREEVLSIIKDLNQKTEQESRKEFTTVGLEWEQAGGMGNQVILTDHFAELFNVLPQGGDRTCNEILSIPTTGTIAQHFLISLITDPNNGYVNTSALWHAEREAGRSLSSLHVNIGVPKDFQVIGISQWQIEGYMDPIMKATWMTHGGDVKQSYMAKGRVKSWAPGSLLDTVGDKDPAMKLEIRNSALDPEGRHREEIDSICMVASACMQHIRAANGLKVSGDGSMLADIYREFMEEVGVLKYSVNAEQCARELLTKYAEKVRMGMGVKRGL